MRSIFATLRNEKGVIKIKLRNCNTVIFTIVFFNCWTCFENNKIGYQFFLSIDRQFQKWFKNKIHSIFNHNDNVLFSLRKNCVKLMCLHEKITEPAKHFRKYVLTAYNGVIHLLLLNLIKLHSWFSQEKIPKAKKFHIESLRVIDDRWPSLSLLRFLCPVKCNHKIMIPKSGEYLKS